MKSYIEKKILHHIVARVNCFLHKTGLCFSIERLSMLNFNTFKLHNITIIKSDQELIMVDSLLVKISLWSFIFLRQVRGVLKINKISSIWNAIAKQTLYLCDIESEFKIKLVAQSAVFYVAYNDLIIYLNGKKNKDHTIDFRVKMSGTWDSYLSIFQDNLFFDELKYLRSSDNIAITAIAKAYTSEDSKVFFNASIGANNVTLNYYPDGNNEKPFTIDKHFLLHHVQKYFEGDIIHNQTFIPIGKIPNYFINAIICTEDPNFWQHKGVDPLFIGHAISTNLKSRKFERGASTITMQLVRNLFLNHDKTVLRKLEEIIVALLLENYYKIDKKDILEVYVNLIEFAPNVRGLNHASLFYFGKPYTVLTLTECIVLTYIIPRPKHFYEALLVKSEQLKQNLYSHICTYATVMKRRGLISSKEYNEISGSISFANDFGLLPLADSSTTVGKREVELLVVHCTGASQNQPISHILSGWKSAGWINPGYHYLVEADGTCIQLHPESFPSNGVKGYNNESIHICYIGGVNSCGVPIDNRTLDQKHTLLAILKELVQRYPEARILGHRDLLAEDSPISKSCPCFNAAEEYASLRSV